MQFPSFRLVSISDHHWLPNNRSELEKVWGDRSAFKTLESLVSMSGKLTPPKTQWIDNPNSPLGKTEDRFFEIEFSRPDNSSSQTLRMVPKDRKNIVCLYLLAIAEILYLPFPAPPEYTLRTLLKETEVFLALPNGESVSNILAGVRSVASLGDRSVYHLLRASFIVRTANLLGLPSPYENESASATIAKAKETTKSPPSSNTTSPPKPIGTNKHTPTPHQEAQIGNSSDLEATRAREKELNGSQPMEIDPPSPTLSAVVSSLNTPIEAPPAVLLSEAELEARKEEMKKNLPEWTQVLAPVENFIPLDSDMQEFVNYDWDDIIPCDLGVWQEWREYWTDPARTKESVRKRACELVLKLHKQANFTKNEYDSIFWSEELYLLWVLYKETVSSALREILYDGQDVCGLEVIRLRLLNNCEAHVLPKFLHLLLQCIASCPNPRQAALDTIDHTLMAHFAHLAEWAVSKVKGFDACEILMYLCRLVNFSLMIVPTLDKHACKVDRIGAACKVLAGALKDEKLPWLEAAIRIFARPTTVPLGP